VYILLYTYFVLTNYFNIVVSYWIIYIFVNNYNIYPCFLLFIYDTKSEYDPNLINNYISIITKHLEIHIMTTETNIHNFSYYYTFFYEIFCVIYNKAVIVTYYFKKNKDHNITQIIIKMKSINMYEGI